MSRCTIRLACAWATALSTSRKTRTRAPDVQGVVVTVAIDRHAVHVLQYEKRLTRFGDAGVNQLRDVRMDDACQEAALPGEARFVTADKGDRRKLDSGTPLEAAVAALREPDDAHAAGAERRQQAIRSAAPASGGDLREGVTAGINVSRRAVGEDDVRGGRDRAVNSALGLSIELQQ